MKSNAHLNVPPHLERIISPGQAAWMRLLQRKGLTLSEITGRCKSPVTRQHVVDLLYTSVVAQ